MPLVKISAAHGVYGLVEMLRSRRGSSLSLETGTPWWGSQQRDLPVTFGCPDGRTMTA